MSELPRTRDVPLDAERIEEAFSSFSERVRELESVASELRAELRALRAERGPSPMLDKAVLDDDEDWPVEPGTSTPAPSPDWVAVVPPPLSRPTAVPRLAAEGGFLVLVALLAGLADLSAAWIVLVMAAAWALVALSEWAAAAKRARWRLEEVAPAVATGPGADLDTTGPWDMPVVQATVVEAPDESESRTVVAALPAKPESEPESPAPAAEETTQHPRSRFRFRRRPPVETTPDPWEA